MTVNCYIYILKNDLVRNLTISLEFSSNLKLCYSFHLNINYRFAARNRRIQILYVICQSTKKLQIIVQVPLILFGEMGRFVGNNILSK